MENGSTGPVDGRVYVDESGVTGFVEKPGAKGLGLLLGVVVRESDDAAVRKALQPSFERFVKALPSGMKPHITDAFASPDRAVGTVAAETREMYEQIAMQQPVTVIYEAISASAFARR